MPLDTGYYPNQAQLILDPTDYGTGGTDLGKVQSIHTASVIPQFEFLTEHATGNQNVDARMTGLQATYLIHMIDFTTDLLAVTTNNMNNGDSLIGQNNYNIGDLLSAAQTNKLLVRPITDAGAFDGAKPVAYIPRAINIAALNGVWDRRSPLTNGWVLQITALLDTDYGGPIGFGDYNDLPALGVPVP